MTKKIIGFIESNTTGTGLLFLEKALQLGYRALFLTSNPERYSFLSRVNAEIILVDTQDLRALSETLKMYSPSLVALFSTSEYFIEMTAAVAKDLGLPGNLVSAISDCRNKKVFYEKLAKTPFLIPKTWFVENLDHLIRQRHEFTFPLVVKPVAGTGSIGVKRCAHLGELVQHVEQLLAITTNERGGKAEQGVLIQRYIPGAEYSAEIVVRGNEYHFLGITGKHTTDTAYFIETGHDFPALIPQDLQLKIEGSLKSVLKFFQFSFGPVHIEFKLHESDLLLIEINPRLAGGMIPQLISYACQVDIYETILKLYAGEKVDLPSLKYQGASIRFFLAEQSGQIVDLVSESVLKKSSEVIEVHLNKKVGDHITVHHDFRDRFGCLITRAPNSFLSQQAADQAMQHFYVKIEPKSPSASRGRLSEGPHPLLQQLLKKSKSEAFSYEELRRIASIDMAHILMLHKQQILHPESAILLLKAIRAFETDLPHFFDQLDFSRGTYYAYEAHLRGKLGIEIAGNNHIARSRNDINAALFYLLSRESFQKIFWSMIRLVEALLTQAKKSDQIPLPIYSQHQPAMPGNYAFYLLAMLQSILRNLEDLTQVEKHLNYSPLGAGAGCGTDISIDSRYVASLLGFETVFENAFDAIVNRDFALRYKGILAHLCTTLSRMAQDYQLWTMQESHFFELPDDLCGSSSMMPQKKNPYLLEIVKTKTMDVITNLHTTYAKMHKVPMGNSIEVSSASYDTLEWVTQECLDVIDLMMLVIIHAQAIPKNMVAASRKGLTIATFVANQMRIQESFSFREAHLAVGEMIRKAHLMQEDAFVSLAQYINPSSFQDDQALIHEITQSLKYGGGPASPSLVHQITLCQQEMQRYAQWIQDKEARWNRAISSLNRDVDELINRTS